MALLNMIIYFVCAVIWLFRALNGQNIIDFLLTFIWICGGVVWTVRYINQRKSTKDKE